MKRRKSFEIALSAIACAVAAGFLMLGSVSPFLLAAGYLVAAFAIMVPLSKDFPAGAFLCYLAAGLISVWLSPARVLPYALFFGLHPIVNYLQRRYVKSLPLKAVCEAVKTVWFVLSMWLSYLVLKAFAGFVFPELFEQYFFLILFLGGTVFFLGYDFMMFRCQRSADMAIKRIGR